MIRAPHYVRPLLWKVLVSRRQSLKRCVTCQDAIHVTLASGESLRYAWSMEAVEESPGQELMHDAPAKPRSPYLFTSETAKINVAKAWEIRRKREAEYRKSIDVARMSDDTYRNASLLRTRKLIEDLEAKLEVAPDCKSIGFLANALSKLRDVEQKLAGRPNPGNLRPTKASTRAAAPTTGPEE